MSPEYVVGVVKKTQKPKIDVNLLPGEVRWELRDELIIPHIAESDLQEEYGFYKARKTLSRIFPEEIAERFLRAVMNMEIGVSVTFKKLGPNRYEIILNNIDSETEKPA